MFLNYGIIQARASKLGNRFLVGIVKTCILVNWNNIIPVELPSASPSIVTFVISHFRNLRGSLEHPASNTTIRASGKRLVNALHFFISYSPFVTPSEIARLKKESFPCAEH
jgi:hypothetical protein